MGSPARGASRGRKKSVPEVSGGSEAVGPRPASWNQYDLIAERDKHGANDVRLGLTGWARAN